MKSKKKGLLDKVVDYVALFPWWVGIILAILSYLLLHDIAMQQADVNPPVSPDFAIQLGSLLYRIFAYVGQYIFPLAFIGGAIGSILRRKKRAELLQSDSESKDEQA